MVYLRSVVQRRLLSSAASSSFRPAPSGVRHLWCRAAAPALSSSPLALSSDSRLVLERWDDMGRFRLQPNASFSSDVADPPRSSGVFDKISFIGSGKMAEAMISPLINTNIQSAENISIFDVSTTAMERVSSSNPGIGVAQTIPDCISDADLIVLAVKPQNVEKVYTEIRRARSMSSDEVTLRPDAVILSIIAGTPISSFVEGTGMPKIARSMPNTPAQIGKGVTVWSCTDSISADERKRIKDVLCCFGKAIFVDDESFIDMSTSISGSGPAYIFLLMEAMIDAGVHMGFSRDTATTLVHHTLLGSTLYAMETGEHPAILRNSVTSPAGTTASAIYELENGKFRVVIKDAIWACYRRSLEMGGHASNVGPGRTQQAQANNAAIPLAPSAPETSRPVEAPSGEFTDVGKNGD